MKGGKFFHFSQSSDQNTLKKNQFLVKLTVSLRIEIFIWWSYNNNFLCYKQIAQSLKLVNLPMRRFQAKAITLRIHLWGKMKWNQAQKWSSTRKIDLAINRWERAFSTMKMIMTLSSRPNPNKPSRRGQKRISQKDKLITIVLRWE